MVITRLKQIINNLVWKVVGKTRLYTSRASSSARGTDIGGRLKLPAYIKQLQLDTILLNLGDVIFEENWSGICSKWLMVSFAKGKMFWMKYSISRADPDWVQYDIRKLISHFAIAWKWWNYQSVFSPLPHVLHTSSLFNMSVQIEKVTRSMSGKNNDNDISLRAKGLQVFTLLDIDVNFIIIIS